MKYRHFVTGENLKQGVFFASLENMPNSMEVHTRSNKQTESLLFDVSSLWQNKRLRDVNWRLMKLNKALRISMKHHKA